MNLYQNFFEQVGLPVRIATASPPPPQGIEITDPDLLQWVMNLQQTPLLLYFVSVQQWQFPAKWIWEDRHWMVYHIESDPCYKPLGPAELPYPIQRLFANKYISEEFVDYYVIAHAVPEELFYRDPASMVWHELLGSRAVARITAGQMEGANRLNVPPVLIAIKHIKEYTAGIKVAEWIE